MAKASKPAGPPQEITYRRVNWKALLILGVGFLVVVGLVVAVKINSDRFTRRSALTQAQASEAAGDVDLALRQLEGFITTWPDDVDGLKLQSRLLAQSAQNIPQIQSAAAVNDRLLRMQPDSPESQDVRRRLIQLYVRLSDALRQNAEIIKDRGSEANELRYRTAASIARQLIDKGAKDGEAHRLHALALEGLVVKNDAQSLDQAISEFQKALEIDPHDTVAAEHLARLQQRDKKDPAAAEATMDALLNADPKSVAVRMARYRYFVFARDMAKSLAEIDKASEMAPQDLEVQVAAANDALQRLDFARAERHINAIPNPEANELQIRTLRGSLDLSQLHPDEAVEEWRKGLLAVGGGNIELTWRLAYTLIELGRLKDAKPLIQQFERLAGEDRDAMARFLRALYAQKGNNPSIAKKILERTIDLMQPVYKPDAYLTLGRCYEALNNPGQAMLNYQKAANLVPSSPIPRREIARLVGTTNTGDAVKEMDRVLSQNPNDLSLVVELARMQLNQQLALPKERRLWGGVEELINRAIQLDPTSVPVATLQADALAATERLDDARDLLKRSLSGPGRKKPELWLTYAGALDRLDRREEALQALEEGSKPDAAGDHAMLRIARAKVLARLGRAQAARDVLTKDRDQVPRSERPELARTLGELCRELGDRQGALDALADWAKQVPDKAEPALALLAFAQSYNDDKAAKLGLDALRTVDGGDIEPYGRAARALELLRIDRPRSDTAEMTAPTDPAELKRLDEADKLVTLLNEDAPQLTIVPMLQGMIAERRGKPEEAIEAYRKSIKDGSLSPALARLVELLTRRKRFAEIEQLKAQFAKRASKDNIPSLITSFDQINAAVALKVNDPQRAEDAVAAMVAAQPNSLIAVSNQARLLSNHGKNGPAEESLRQLALRRPADTAPWIALVAFRVQHPELGPMAKLIDEIRLGYKGAHPELLEARCLWINNEIDAAAKKYEAALAQNGDDLTTLRDAAEFYEANGRLKESEPILRRAIKKDPKTTSWACRALALNLTTGPDRDNWSEAWALIKPGAPGAGETPEDRLVRATMLARSPESSDREQAVPTLIALANDLPASNPVAIEARMRLAQAHMEANQPALAVRLIAPVADNLDQPNALALALSIEGLARINDLDSAQKQLDRLVALEPKSPRTAASKVWVLQKTNQPNEAVATAEASFNEALNAPNGEPIALAFQDLLIKVGNKEGALKLAQRITAKWPRDAYILAKAELSLGQIAEAIKNCDLAMKAGEIQEALRVATSIAIEKRNDPVTLQAIDDLVATALAQGSKNAEVFNFIATLRHLQGRYEDEINMYQQAIASVPTSYLFLNNMAWTLAEGLQRYDDALQRVNEVIRREGANPQFLDTRGVILARLNRLDEAVSDLETSVKNFPLATTYFHLARTYKQLNKMSEYRQARDRAQQLKLDIKTLDPTDRADVSAIMNGN